MNNAWILTDPDSFQISRKLDETKFELYQINDVSTDNEGFMIAHAVIYTEELDVESILDCYGYSSMKELKETYGNDTDQILAECDFELQSACGECFVSNHVYHTFKEAENLIRCLSGYTDSFLEKETYDRL